MMMMMMMTTTTMMMMMIMMTMTMTMRITMGMMMMMMMRRRRKKRRMRRKETKATDLRLPVTMGKKMDRMRTMESLQVLRMRRLVEIQQWLLRPQLQLLL